MRKYTKDNLLPMFMKAAELRNEMIAEGFTDNGGAIHSAERILDILGRCECYPPLGHINSLKRHPDAERTLLADKARREDKSSILRIEHVSPHRALTRMAIEAAITDGEKGVIQVVLECYRLVLLTADEMATLNRANRSSFSPTRLENNGIEIIAGRRPPWTSDA